MPISFTLQKFGEFSAKRRDTVGETGAVYKCFTFKGYIFMYILSENNQEFESGTEVGAGNSGDGEEVGKILRRFCY